MKPYSIKRRLTVLLIGLTLLTWAISVAVTTFHASRRIVDQLDLHLRHYADIGQHSVAAVLEDPHIRAYFQSRSISVPSGKALTRITSFVESADSVAINLWFDKSQVLVGQAAPRFPRPDAEGIVNRYLEEGSRWRIIYRHYPEYQVWQAVGVDLRLAQQGGWTAFWRGVVPMLVVLPITLVLLFFGIRQGLKPLDRLAGQISTRQPQTLEPFEVAEVPQELQPVVVALNGLLQRLERALASEHRFTANAAHELQTPLAAIQVAVQGCQRQLVDTGGCSEVRQMLDKISVRISSATETVKQLLLLARLDPDQEFDRESVELEVLIADAMAEVGSLAMERDISVRFNDAARTAMRGQGDWLGILLRNLFTNAFKYAPAGSEVEVRVQSRDEHTMLTIVNDGDVIPDHEFQRLADRFYHPSTGAPHGVGLGLSIVERIVELHKASMHLGPADAERGFKVEIRFPV